jgi:hypothetical protein
LRYRKTYLNEVTDVNIKDENATKGLHVFDNGSILPKTKSPPRDSTVTLSKTLGIEFNLDFSYG